MYLLYNLAIWMVSPILLAWLFARRKAGRLPGLATRMGLVPAGSHLQGGPLIWFHAVSLGEMKTAQFLAARLRHHRPAVRFLFTASTTSGYEEARSHASAADTILFPPLDVPWICRRFLRRFQPDAVLIFETELWPNLFRETKRAGVNLVLLNGRISDRAWPRYQATRFFWRRVLSYPDAFYVQSARDAQRFSSLGAPAQRVHIAGNLKFAIAPPTSPLAEALQTAVRQSAVEPVLVAGSTMEGEEEYLLEAFLALRREFPRLWMILAPRHPQRATSVSAVIHAAGVPLQRRSQWRPGEPVLPGIFLLDTTGELASLYQLATAAFVGGTLVSTGGHNIVEPAHFACPTVIGPSMENFRELADQFLDAGAVIQVQDAGALTGALRQLFQDAAYRRRVGQAARQLLERQSAGLAEVLEAVQRGIRGACDSPPHEPITSASAAAGAGSCK